MPDSSPSPTAVPSAPPTVTPITADATAVQSPSPPSPTLADRLKKCITVVHGLRADNPSGPADKDLQFLFTELLELMQLAEANKL